MIDQGKNFLHFVPAYRTLGIAPFESVGGHRGDFGTRGRTAPAALPLTSLEIARLPNFWEALLTATGKFWSTLPSVIFSRSGIIAVQLSEQAAVPGCSGSPLAIGGNL